MYTSKTTLVEIFCGWWTDRSKETHSGVEILVEPAKRVALLIAQQCQMDIMSMSYRWETDQCVATVVYVNNGVSLVNIREIMAPEIDKRMSSWTILDLYGIEGSLECLMSVKGTDEAWS